MNKKDRELVIRAQSAEERLIAHLTRALHELDGVGHLSYLSDKTILDKKQQALLDTVWLALIKLKATF